MAAGKHQPDSTSTSSSTSNGAEIALVGASSVAFGFLFSYPILPHLRDFNTFWDWDFIRVLAWVPWKTVTSFHQFPVWNPYLCGGIPMLGDPQASFFTPLFLLHLIFGPIVGLHLEIPVHLAIGWAGGYVLARVLRLGTLAAITCATIFPSSSWLFLHMTVGHHIFLPATYWPWVLAATLLALERRSLAMASVAGLLMALIFLEGAPYQESYAVLLVAAILLPIGLVRRDAWPFVVFGTILIFAAGFAAVKLIPTYAFVALHSRPAYWREHVLPSHIAIALFDRNQEWNHYGIADWGFFEAGAYLSPFFFILVLIGAIARRRDAWPWMLAGAIMLGLAMGNFAPFAPWTLLRHLPIYSSERVAIRLLVPFILCAGVLAAYSVEFLSQWKRPSTMALAGLLIIAGAIDSLAVGPHNLANIQTYEEPPVSAAQAFTQFRNPDENEFTLKMLRFNRANIGMLHCYEFTDIPTNAVGYNEPGYEGEQHLTGRGEVSPLQWTPNALTYQVEAPEPTTLVINQNYDRGWRLVRGAGRVVPHDGLLAIELPAGHQQLKVMNLGDGIMAGALISLATAIVALVLWRKRL